MTFINVTTDEGRMPNRTVAAPQVSDVEFNAAVERAKLIAREKEVQSDLRRALKEEVGDQEFPKDNKHAQAKFQMLRQKFGIIPPRYTESEREIING
jgi:hypothetical protein